MNRYLLLFFICLLCLSEPAFCQPKVTVIPVNKQIDFDLSQPVTNCGPNAAGCTMSVAYAPSIRVDCNTETIVLDFSRFSFLIQIANEYKKGTPEFDYLVKHELTHVALHQRVVEKFYQPIASAVLLRFEKSLKEKKTCQQSQQDVFDVFNEYIERLKEETDKQNSLIDSDENYDYQWRQVYRNKREKNRTTKQEKKFLKPKVFVTLLETEHQYDIKSADFQPTNNGKGMIKNIATGAFLELDPAVAEVNCDTGVIKLKLGFKTTVAFNEQKGTFLYNYLLESLNNRVKILQERSRNVPETIKKDIAGFYEKLVQSGAECADIRIRLKKRMSEYQRKVSEEIKYQNNILGNAVPLWRDYFEKDQRAYASVQKQPFVAASNGSNPSLMPEPQNNTVQVNAASVLAKSPENDQQSKTVLKDSQKDQQIVMNSTDRYFINKIRQIFSSINRIFDLEKKFNNFLEKIKNQYLELTSAGDPSATKETKTADKPK